jgi:hypothetical protein
MIGLTGCVGATDGPVNNADTAIAKAMVAIKREFPQGKPDPKDFRAYLRDGNWYVEEIMPPDTLGGGVDVVISQRDGKVVQVALIQ